MTLFAGVGRSPRRDGSATCRRCGSTGPRTSSCRWSIRSAAIEVIRGDDFEQRIYEGAAHEVFNETNRDEVLDDVAASSACAQRGSPVSSSTRAHEAL